MGRKLALLGKTPKATLNTGKGAGRNPPVHLFGFQTSTKKKSLNSQGKKIQKKGGKGAFIPFPTYSLRSQRAKSPPPPQIVGMEIESGDPVPYLKHAEIDVIAAEIGKEMAVRPIAAKNKFVVPVPDGYKDGKIHAYLSSRKEMDKKEFGPMYRDLLKGMDEPASTSLVRQIMKGIISAKISDPAKLAEISQAMENISRIRFDTVEVGVSTASYKLQHPCPATKGLFEESALTSKEHSKLDRYRKNYVVAKAKEHMKEPDWDVYSMAKAIITASVTFTLNAMSAPISASDIHPFSKMSRLKTDSPEMQEYIIKRNVKKLQVAGLGGILEVDGETDPVKMLGRSYESRQNDMLAGLKTGKTIRSMSPVRIPSAKPSRLSDMFRKYRCRVRATLAT